MSMTCRHCISARRTVCKHYHTKRAIIHPNDIACDLFIKKYSFQALPVDRPYIQFSSFMVGHNKGRVPLKGNAFRNPIADVINYF